MKAIFMGSHSPGSLQGNHLLVQQPFGFSYLCRKQQRLRVELTVTSW